MEETARDVVAFEDANGTRWTVREANGPATPAHPNGSSLVFESATAVRRVWNYPPGWRGLAPHELESLSWKT